MYYYFIIATKLCFQHHKGICTSILLLFMHLMSAYSTVMIWNEYKLLRQVVDLCITIKKMIETVLLSTLNLMVCKYICHI